MAERSRILGVPRELPTVALVGAAALPLSRLFRPGGFTGVALSAVILSALMSWIARRLRAPAVLSLLMSLAALLWFLGGRFYPDTLFAGIFPTAATMHGIIDGVQVGVKQTIEEAVPVIASGPLLMFVAAGAWLTMWLADAAAVWVTNPLLAISTTIPLFATPGTLVPSTRRWVDTGLFVAAAAWVLYSDERWRARRWRTREEARFGWRPGPALRLGAVAVVIVMVVAPLLPGWGAPPLLQTKGPGARITFNPFVAIRPTLRRQPEVTLFAVRTSRPTYFRLTALDRFDGDVWSQRSSRPAFGIGSSPIQPFTPEAPGTLITQQVRIEGLAGQWLPASYDPVEVDGLTGLRIERDARAILTGDGRGLETGTEYQVVSRIADLTQANLDGPIEYDRGALKDYLDLPPSAALERVRRIAQQVAGAQPTPFQKVVALQNYLRGFTYDENVAAGHSFNDIVDFLTSTKRGYCEQFAGSMAVMARTLGIPSRVAIGFGFGAQQGNVYIETTREAHAWVEIFFPGAGWVTFEPTPRAGVTATPSYATPGIASGASNSPEASASETPGSSPSASSSARSPTLPGGAGDTGRAVWVIFAVAAGAIIALIGSTLALTIGRRTVRRRRAHDARGAVVVRYVEFLGWCSGAGLGRRSSETPAEHATRIAAISADAEAPLARLAELAAEALWALPNGLDPADAQRAATDAQSALGSKLSRRRRLLAAAGFGRVREHD